MQAALMTVTLHRREAHCRASALTRRQKGDLGCSRAFSAVRGYTGVREEEGETSVCACLYEFIPLRGFFIHENPTLTSYSYEVPYADYTQNFQYEE